MPITDALARPKMVGNGAPGHEQVRRRYSTASPTTRASLPMVAKFSAHLAAVDHIAFGINSRQRKLS
jgi:hypothetical protein